MLVAHRGDLAALVDSEARVMLLYCTKQEAIDILTAASDLHLTGENYVWVVTQSVIETADQAPNQFPVGMLGKYKFFIWDRVFFGCLWDTIAATEFWIPMNPSRPRFCDVRTLLE